MEKKLHVPALLNEVIDLLKPKDGGVYLDGTLGYGGYSLAILRESSPTGIVFGFDLDRSAIEAASSRLTEYGNRFRPVHLGYHEALRALIDSGIDKVDGIALDLGLSSTQIDDPERGFSFRFEGPLDMRFDTDSGLTLIEILKTIKVSDLERVLRDYGEERFSSRIAKAIVESGRKGSLKTTSDLAELVARVIPGRRGKIHPATRTFQGLRIMVNHELDNLTLALKNLPDLLKVGARLCVVSYHSLEDRLVKVSFRELSKSSTKYRIVTPKPVRPSSEEARSNPRARSAKLRAIEVVS